MSYELQSQAYNITPPRKSQGFQLTADGTARAYSLLDLAFGGVIRDPAAADKGLYLTLFADGGDIYYVFQEDNSVSLNEATVIAAGGTLSLQSAFAAKLASGSTVDVRIDRMFDKYIVVKGSGTLRVHVSSQPNR